MNYDFFIKDLDEISQIISLDKKLMKKLTGSDIPLFKQSLHKSLTIALYTFWENFCKKLIYDCYTRYKKILVDKDFLINYFENIQEKSYTRQLFLKSIEDNKFHIKIDNLCYSNNLSFNELKSLFKRLLFDTNEFAKHVDRFSKLDIAILELRNNAIIPEFKEIKSTHDTIECFEAYINLLVENRNKVAHQYIIDEIYTLEQFESILNFIRVATLLVFEFCTSQILKKAQLKGEKIHKRIFPLCIIKSNSCNKTGIVGIRNTTKRIIKQNSNLYWYDKEKEIFRILHIIKIVRNGITSSEILPLDACSIEVDTNASIKNTRKKTKQFIIYDLTETCDSYEYQVMI